MKPQIAQQLKLIAKVEFDLLAAFKENAKSSEFAQSSFFDISWGTGCYALVRLSRYVTIAVIALTVCVFIFIINYVTENHFDLAAPEYRVLGICAVLSLLGIITTPILAKVFNS